MGVQCPAESVEQSFRLAGATLLSLALPFGCDCIDHVDNAAHSWLKIVKIKTLPSRTFLIKCHPFVS